MQKPFKLNRPSNNRVVNLWKNSLPTMVPINNYQVHKIIRKFSRFHFEWDSAIENRRKTSIFRVLWIYLIDENKEVESKSQFPSSGKVKLIGDFYPISLFRSFRSPHFGQILNLLHWICLFSQTISVLHWWTLLHHQVCTFSTESKVFLASTS